MLMPANALLHPPAPVTTPATGVTLNTRVLATDAHHIGAKGINAYENPAESQDVAGAVREHEALMKALAQIGVHVDRIPCPPECQDGVFTANWGLTWGGRALLSRLPNARQSEEPHAEAALQKLGFETKRASRLFSGQGDAMIIGGNRVLIGDGYRTDATMAHELRDWLGLEPIVVRTKPKRHWYGAPVRNKVTGLWDSFFYDLDIAVGVIRPDLIAVCYDALTKEGRQAIGNLKGVEIIPVDFREARDSFATNLISIDQTVIMSDGAPKLAAALQQYGCKLVQLPNNELKKSGGGFRCSTLSLYS